MGLFITIKLQDEFLRVDLEQVANVMRDYGQQVDERARLVLESEGKNSTGNLSESIQHEVSVRGDNVVVSWPMLGAPYWDFVERGVRGKLTANLAPNSPYQFGSGSGPAGGLRPAIRQWISDKPLSQWRDQKSGRFMSYDGMAKMISRKVFLHGIAPTPFLRPSMREVFSTYKGRLEDAYAGDVSVAIGRWLKTKTDSKTIKIKL